MIFKKIAEKETGLKCEKEYQFFPSRKWRFDYYFPDIKTAIEVEGGAWTQGRHTRGKGFIADMEKYNTAGIMGIIVLRVIPNDLLTRKTINMLLSIIALKNAGIT